MRTIRRLWLWSYAVLLTLAFCLSGELTAGDAGYAAILASFIAPVAFLPFAFIRLARRSRGGNAGLDKVLFRYPTGDPFYLRHLLTSICIFGIIGAGKSSSSGLFFARLVVGIHSSGIILASNPDDLKWWKARFAEAGRPADLVVFSPSSKERWNFLSTLQAGGADAREITSFLVTAAESLSDSAGDGEEIYWKQSSERLLFNIISALMMAGYAVSAGAIANFLGSAAFSKEELETETYKTGFSNQVLEEAEAKATDPLRAGDFAMLHNFWRGGFVFQDAKTRSIAQSMVENITHCLSVGIAREIFSTTTTASCADLLKGKWLLMDFPVSKYSVTARMIYGCAKLAVQKQVLKNDWNPSQPITVIWADEASHILNSGDRDALKEFRKHGGVLIYLTQTILDYFVAMGKDGKAKAEGLLGLFGTRVFHSADVATATYAVELVGEAEQEEQGGSYTPSHELIDRMGGKSQWSSSFNRRRLPLMTGRQLTAGLRMGGKSKTVDAWVYRPELYSDGTNMQLVTFYQD